MDISHTVTSHQSTTAQPQRTMVLLMQPVRVQGKTICLVRKVLKGEGKPK